MGQKPKKKKLCWNCEGSASFESENCPYCGVYLSSISLAGNEGKETLFAPPYKTLAKEEEPQEVPPSPYGDGSAEEESNSEAISTEKNSWWNPEKCNTVLCLFCLSAGLLFLFFGLLLLLFSRQGVFTLQWDGSYWPAYMIIGLPLLALSWWYLSLFPQENVKEEETFSP